MDTVLQQIFKWVLTVLPAFFAAAFGAASFAVAKLSGARRAALLQVLAGAERAAIDRYIAKGSAIEVRWLVLRGIGISATAVMAAERLEHWSLAWRLLGSALCAVIAYGIPAEIARVIVQRTPEYATTLLLRLLRPIEYLAVPIAAPISFIGRIAWSSESPTSILTAGVTETEVEIIVKEGEQTGALAHDQSEMIRNVLDFGGAVAGDVMVPRTRVRALEIQLPADDVLRFIDECGHSRYPVYRDRIDNVVGILHVKDLLTYAGTHDLRKLELGSLVRKAVAFVPESQSASSVLKDMRVGRHHMAIIIDEYGGMSGVVTLEDLVEEIIGDIRDEHDAQLPAVREMGDGHLLVDASISVTDLSRRLDTEIPESGDYNSLGGFMVARMGRVPKTGARLKTLGIEFVVHEADERHIATVEIFHGPAIERASNSTAPSSSNISAA